MDFKLFILNACVLLWTFRVPCISSANCSTVFQGLPTFQNCTYRCHCKNDVQCDEQTGSCDDGCEFGWMGPGCQYRNIAQFNTKTQSVGGTSIVADYGINAVDGDVTTCARTTTAGPDSNYRSYWRIQWEKEYRIVGLVIKIGSNEMADFNKFRVETGTGPNNGDFNIICYQHGDAPGTQEMEIMCRQPVWTKHLRIILDKQITEMRVCEVEIYGGRDLTFNRPTFQSSTFTEPNTNWAWASSRAVDGRAHTSDITARDTCSATNHEKRPYWKIDLLTEYVVQSIYFYGRRESYDQYSFFQISLIKDGSNERVLVYLDPGNSNSLSYQPKHVDLSTIVTGRYLEVDRQLDYNTLLTICEIIAYGECPPGKCGWDCDIDCHCAAEITGTFQKDRICPNGCSGRWTGVNKTCTLECTLTQWGYQCQSECGSCYRGETCDVVTGQCENGCSGPLQPPLCTQECTNQTYGLNCAKACGQCKDSLQCDIQSGVCDQGCVIGMQPPLCQEACSSGTYGDGCTNQCGDCLDGVTCQPETGVCENGCATVNYQTTFCNETCDSGWYGDNCTDECGQCKKGMTCNVTTGICDQGCQAGWTTNYCNQSCANGTYGEGCDQQCGKCFNNEVCNTASGRCPNGCQAGFEGEMCKSECSVGYFGPNCADECHCADKAPCDRNNGTCQSPVCKLGWTGQACNTECPIHRFGEECKNECFCKEGTCTKDYGICNGVCQAGYRGTQCNEACPSGTFGESCTQMCHCQNATCTADDGLCPGDCIDGYEGHQCNKKSTSKSIVKNNTVVIAIGGGVGALVLIVILIVVICRYRIYKREQCKKDNYASTDNIKEPPGDKVYDSIYTDVYTNEAQQGETNM